jgi:TatD DNase family protein
VLIDTHCHLGDPAFAPDRDEVIGRMRAAGVGRALVVESALAGLAATLAWAAREPGIGVATACHPHDASAWNPALRTQLHAAWARPEVLAIGEIGLDYHYDHSPRETQRTVFAEQLALAVERHKPVVIHAREADEDVVAVLREQPDAGIVLHSFSSGPTLREAGLAAGWYFSFSGMVTFNSWRQEDTVRAVPDGRLLIETDAPYLAPVPHRGKRNEPAFVAEVARKVAALRGVSFEELAALTTANAERLFWNATNDHR